MEFLPNGKCFFFVSAIPLSCDRPKQWNRMGVPCVRFHGAVQLCRRARVSIRRRGRHDKLALPEEFSVTPQEQEVLKQLTDRINQTQLQEKDPDAENMLGHELGANPDALYILAQTVLVQNIALDQAKAQVAQLQQQVHEAR